MIERNSIRQVIGYIPSKAPSTGGNDIHIDHSTNQAKRCIKDYNPIAHRPACKLRKTIGPGIYGMPLIAR
jgi:hypothetical protein